MPKSQQFGRKYGHDRKGEPTQHVRQRLDHHDGADVRPRADLVILVHNQQDIGGSRDDGGKERAPKAVDAQIETIHGRWIETRQKPRCMECVTDLRRARHHPAVNQRSRNAS